MLDETNTTSLSQSDFRLPKNFMSSSFQLRSFIFATDFLSQRSRDRLQEEIERTLGTRRLQFIAIDGTCRREQFADMLTFFGGAYGARGELELDAGDHKVHYKRWSLEQDVSMVAWIPVHLQGLKKSSHTVNNFWQQMRKKLM